MNVVEVRRASLPTPDCGLVVTADRVVLVADHRVSDRHVETALGLARLAFEVDGRWFR